MLHNCYQSWSYTGVEPIPAALTDVNGTVPHGGDNGNELGEIPGVSWWWTAVSDVADQGMVLGADGASFFKSYVGVDRTRLRLVMGLTGDVLQVAPGETVVLDGVVATVGDIKEGLESYAAAVARAHLPSTARKEALGGWGSWNFYYSNINAAQVRQEMDWSLANLVPLGLKTVLLDDGYETRWGEWTAAPEFGGTLTALASEQGAQGQSPALWIAPFLVETSSSLVADHPDWFVHLGGALRKDHLAGGQEVAYLDATQPNAVAHVTDQLTSLAAAGYQTFKIDFLYGGAIEGQRAQPVTSMQAYRTFLQALRDAVPSAHLVGCGAPMLPSVGLVDSMRTGPDIAYTVSPTPVYTFYAGQARHTAMRGYTDAWWSLDPDVLILRGTTFSDEDAWTGTVSSAMAGGNYLLGDARQAGGRRVKMALDPAILAMTRDGHAARPTNLALETDGELYGSPLLDVMALTAPPHVWQKTSSDGNTHWLAVFAWAVENYSAKVSLPSGAVELVPPANDTAAVTTSPAPTDGNVQVAAHRVRLFRW
jgi:hypothetical protein